MNQYLEDNKQRFLDELVEWLRIPSVSTDPAHSGDVRKAGEFVRKKLEEAGADKTEICETDGFPIIYAEKIIDPALPTVLVYGHYDVQPADPLELWHSPPFEPVVKDGNIYARGACDDKGQTYMHVKAFEAMVKTNNLPCNIKFMIEGEEEIGSDSLEGFVKANHDRLAADVILVSDTSMLANDIPSITTGLRGMSYVEIEVTGPNRDLHSGLYGGAVANPLNVLSEIVASLKNEDGRITIDGFYDDVADLSDEERSAMAEAPFSLDAYKGALGISDVRGETGYSTLERVTIRPTLDVNGIWGGYMQEGAKTVIASKGHAKISMRLVPNQSSEKITQLFTEHIEKIKPPYVDIKVTHHHGGEPVVTPIDSIAYKAASLAMEETFGKKPIPMRGGGSIPIIPMFKSLLGTDSILMGFGLDSDAIHSPNEHYGLFNFYTGIKTIPLFYKHLTQLKK